MPTLQKKKLKKPVPTFGSMAKKVKKLSMFRPKVRSRHPSHNPLRRGLTLLPFKAVVRLGSTTDIIDTVTNGGDRIECNTVEAVKNAASKFKMKERFAGADVLTAKYCRGGSHMGFLPDNTGISNGGIELRFPVVAKLNYGSRGEGMHLVNNRSEFEDLSHTISSRINEYLFEEYHNYNREYRLHITKDGCFYACRKMLKEGSNERWFRNDTNCIWVVEDNPVFEKPTNWIYIVAECVKALNAVGLDIGACDVRVQSKAKPKFFIVEINSAPSFGQITTDKYLTIIPRILTSKAKASGKDTSSR